MRGRPKPRVRLIDPARGQDLTAWSTSDAGLDVLARVLAAGAAPVEPAPRNDRRSRLRPALRPGLAAAALTLVMLLGFTLLPGAQVDETVRDPGGGQSPTVTSLAGGTSLALQKLSVLLLSAGIASSPGGSVPSAPLVTVADLVKEIETLATQIGDGTLVGKEAGTDSALAMAILADLRLAIERGDISLVLTEDVTPEQRAAIRKMTASFPEVRSTTYLNPEDTWVLVREELPSTVVEQIQRNPLRASLELKVISPESVPAVAARLVGLPGVERVVYGQALAPAVVDGVLALLSATAE